MIIYTTFQAQADEFSRFLSSHGIPCASYHAGRNMQVLLLAQVTRYSVVDTSLLDVTELEMCFLFPRPAQH